MQRSHPLLILRIDPERDADRLSDRFARHGYACAIARYRADGSNLPATDHFKRYAGAILLGTHYALDATAPRWQALRDWLTAWTGYGRPLLAEGSGAALLTCISGGTLGASRPALGWFPATPGRAARGCAAPGQSTPNGAGDSAWPERAFVDLDTELHPPPAASVRLRSRALGVLAWQQAASLALAFPPQLCRSNYAEWTARAGVASPQASARVQTADELRHAGEERLPTYEHAMATLLEHWHATLVEQAG